MATETISSFRGLYWPFSNFYVGPAGCVEMLFQAMKTTDPFEQIEILTAPTAAQAKALGRTATLRPDWDEIRDPVMRTLLRHKFTKDVGAKRLLLSTESDFLIEGNRWHDNYWGDCQCSVCSSIEGENKLGHMLMELRDEFRKEKEIKDATSISSY